MVIRRKYARLAVKIGRKDQREIKKLLRKGKVSVRIVKRAWVLRLLNKGHPPSQAAELVEVTAKTAREIGWRYVEGGLQKALHESPRRPRKRTLNSKQSSKIIALVCSSPPEGRSRWTLELISEEIKKRGIASKISKESIRLLMKNHNLKPWRLKMWCIPELNDDYKKKMEDVLDVYEKPYNPKEPVVCFDEKPMQLLAETRKPIFAKKPGQITKQDSEYIRRGTANIFCAIEGKAGKHFTFVTKNRKGPEFAKVINKISKQYPAARTIHLVLDNLNTHREKSLINFYGGKRGKEIWRRFSIHYTPKHGSWLNQAEIEIGIYSRQCLGKVRIGNIEELKRRSKAWNKKANTKKAKIDWKFTTRSARKKFKYK